MDFRIFDADNHYYESEDCFTRYASEKMIRDKAIRWLTEADGKRKRLLIGGREVNTIGNPTFNPIVKPGTLHKTLKNLAVGNDRGAAAYAMVEPMCNRPEYRDKDTRLAVMDKQGVEKAMLFPTLGVTVEGFISHDRELLYECIHSFNQWLLDDWGYAYQDRIYGVPYLSMLDLDRAIAELDWVLKQGAQAITIRPGPAYGRSPADPYFDPFWARVNEAGLLVTYHAYDGPSCASEAYNRQWAAPPQPSRQEDWVLRNVISGVDTSIMDTLSALILHNLFGRFPNIRVASIEMGCGWVPYLIHRLDHAGGLTNRKINAFGDILKDRPSEIFKQKVWVSPFPEEDVVGLTRHIGVDRVLLGSDWPHAEGTPEPLDYLKCLDGLEPASVKRIARDNALELIAA